MLKPHTVVDTTLSAPDEVIDEEYVVPKGQTRYTLRCSDEQVELLARGIVPEDVSARAFRLLEWKRMNARSLSRSLERKKRA